MEYELKTLETIVLDILHPGKLKQANLNATFIAKYRRIVHAEKERIKLQIIQAGFEPGAENRMELYVRQHQTALVQLADAIYFYQHPKSNESVYRIFKDASLIKLYSEIYHCLDCLLNFIENRFAKYANPEAKIMEAYRWSIVPEIKRNVIFLKKEFKKYNAPDELIKIVCEPFDNVLKPEATITCREWKYLKMMQDEMILLTKKRENGNFTEITVSLLLQLNFNSVQFSNYFIDQLIETGKRLNNKTEILAFYSLKLKLINQVILTPGAVYKPNQLSICEQVGRWIKEELSFLEKQQNLKQVPIQKNDMRVNETKVHTSLSVAHLSLAVKLLLDAKIITNKNAREVIRMVARNFRTDKSEHISEDSLWNKAYNIDESTVDKVKDVIKGLMGVAMRY